MTPEGETLLLSAGAELQLDLRPHLPIFAQLQNTLTEGNQQLNLTALVNERDIILKHLIDSLSCDVNGWLTEAGHVLDLGTGAGFPTLPLAILNPHVQFLAVDATRKKTEYVRRTAASLKLRNVEVLASRAEVLGRNAAHREQHQRVVARAVAALPVLAELGLPLLQIGGLLIAQKGQLSGGELAAGQQAAAELGAELFHVKHFELPISRDRRSVVVMHKLSATPDRYPRREGVPNKQPLFWNHEQIKRGEDKKAYR